MRSYFYAIGPVVFELVADAWGRAVYGCQVRAEYDDTAWGRLDAKLAAADLARGEMARRQYEKVRHFNPFGVRPRVIVQGRIFGA